MNKETPLTTFQYIFEMENKTETFTVEIDHNTTNTNLQVANPPAWSKLSFEKCENCHLEESDIPYCPAALSLVDLSQQFKTFQSCLKATTKVVSADRTYLLEGDLQKGLSALVGILLATSGCPKFYLFKSMAHFHLPFANPFETYYRFVSASMLYHHFNTPTEPFSIGNLNAYYQDISVVNRHIFNRLNEAFVEDSGLNSIVMLDVFALNFVMDEQAMTEKLKALFIDS